MILRRMLLALLGAVLAAAPCPAADIKYSTLTTPSSIDATARMVAIIGSGCATGAKPCDNILVSAANLSDYFGLTTSFQPLDGDLTSLANASATNVLYYRSAASTWSAVTIGTGLSFSGGTLATTGVLTAANNLSDVVSAATARINLGLVIGTNVQAYNANLACMAALATAADKVIYWTGSGTCALASAPSFGRSLMAAPDAATARALLGVNPPLCQNAVANSHTGDTNEWTAVTCTIPANGMGANGQVEIVPDWSYTNNSNTKTIRVRFGGTSFASSAYTTSAQGQILVRIANRNATNSQTGTSAGFATSSGAPTTSAIDTTASVPITLTCQLAVTTDTCTLESYIIKLFPAN